MSAWRLFVFAKIIVLISSLNQCLAFSVRYDLHAFDMSSNPVSQVQVGDRFQLVGTVEDVRESPRGILSAYTDVSFSGDSVALVPGSSAFGAEFTTTPKGNFSHGLLDEVGALASGYLSIPPLPTQPNGELPLFTVELTAVGLGSVIFVADPADNLPRNSTTLLGLDRAVSLSEMEFGSVGLTVVPEPAGAGPLVLGLLAVWCALRWRRHG